MTAPGRKPLRKGTCFYFRNHPEKGLQWWVYAELEWHRSPYHTLLIGDQTLTWEDTWCEPEGITADYHL